MIRPKGAWRKEEVSISLIYAGKNGVNLFRISCCTPYPNIFTSRFASKTLEKCYEKGKWRIADPPYSKLPNLWKME
jgi:hypothetical protein